ncbi:MAG: pyridine nucleotide-disulfide oxidoreductase, partial [Alphaproteobacteria bacterium]|nr:pyridine nucleotide-disulfide oxidoreductase [Alphaproteobacteria bacterium]
DGCKIEPIDRRFKNTDLPFVHIHDTLKPLSERMVSGFGGVAEYGITPRWDKNNLFIIRLLLERNPLYTLKGGIFYGDMLRPEDAFNHGIDHIALCTGAGAPKFTQTPNPLARGVYAASDFLMSLQLTGNFKNNSLGCLTVQMPIVVIGGGLTAIDAATEAQAFYIKHLETLTQRMNDLKAKGVWDDFSQNLGAAEAEQLNRWQDHADQLVAAKMQAQEAGKAFNPIDLLHQWGGCTILYRKGMEQAPSLSLNPQEVKHAFHEGIFLLDDVSVTDYHLDDHGAIQGVGIQRLGYASTLPARTVILAVGTHAGGAKF